MFSALLGAHQVQAAWLGGKLGWYECLAEKGPLTTTQLAHLTSSSERYAREWCEHQTISGWISCKDPSAADRLYFLSKAQRAVLTDVDSLSFMLPACNITAGNGRHLDLLKDAYQNDGGVSWDEFGDDARDNQAAMNRSMFLQQLGQEFIPAGLPKVHTTLLDGGRVADIGSWCGWASIGVAQVYPNIHVDAYDLDEPSIQRANRNIVDTGLHDRVTARCVDVGTLDPDATPYDLVIALECVHDMGDPVSVLSSMMKLAGKTGTVMIMDEKGAGKVCGRFQQRCGKVYVRLFFDLLLGRLQVPSQLSRDGYGNAS